MKRNDNICKFVSEKTPQTLTTRAFVYEKNAASQPETRSYNFNVIYFVTQGKGKLITDSGTRDIATGNIFFTFKQIPFKIQNLDKLQYMYITFEGSRSEDLFAHFGISPANCIFEGYERLAPFWESCIIKAGEKNLDLISESVLYYTMGEMVPTKINDEQILINTLLKYIDENFSNNQLNLSMVADDLGYNSKYLSRIFKNSMGINFSSYLTNARIQHALFLMEQGVTSIKNIAFLSGYKDPLYFSNVFKAKTGISPKDYIAGKH